MQLADDKWLEVCVEYLYNHAHVHTPLQSMMFGLPAETAGPSSSCHVGTSVLLNASWAAIAIQFHRMVLHMGSLTAAVET